MLLTFEVSAVTNFNIKLNVYLYKYESNNIFLAL